MMALPRLGLMILLALVTGPSFVHAEQKADPERQTEDILGDYYRALSRFKRECGRYPMTNEGLRALLRKPPALTCTHLENFTRWASTPELRNGRDGWGKPLKYSSDGKTYKIQASQGFWLFPESPSHEWTGHWTNPRIHDP